VAINRCYSNEQKRGFINGLDFKDINSCYLAGLKRLALSVLFTLFICYIDEGYYDLTSFKSLGNWIVFIPYVLIIYLLFSGINKGCSFISGFFQDSKSH
jgi:glycopeptide antibiotics resistance protein